MNLYKQFKYLSHCTNYRNIISILNSNNKLIPGCEDDFTCNKVFFKILDDDIESKYCSIFNSVELIFTPDLLKTEKFYFIYGTYTLGEAEDVLYISPYLFKKIKLLKFDINKFKKWVSQMPNSHAKTILKQETDALFLTDVIKNKYNPTIKELINIENELIMNGNGYAITIGFLESINLKYLCKININKAITNDVQTELSNLFKLHNIKYNIKEYIFKDGSQSMYCENKYNYLKLNNII